MKKQHLYTLVVTLAAVCALMGCDSTPKPSASASSAPKPTGPAPQTATQAQDFAKAHGYGNIHIKGAGQ